MLPEDFESAAPGWTRLRLAQADDWLAQDDRRIRHALFRTGEGALQGRVHFGPGCQGPRDHAHGGSQASILDLALGGVCWVSGLPVVAGNLSVRYHRSLPLEQVVGLRAEVVHQSGRKVQVRGELFDEGGVYASAKGLFVVVRKEVLARFRFEHGVVFQGDPGLEGPLAGGA